MNCRATLLLAASLGLVGLGCETTAPAGCGDGIPIIPEMCDDANLIDGDGCSSGCNLEAGYACSGAPSVCALVPVVGSCGDGELNTTEECDDRGESGACDADCTFATCGDGTINGVRMESCDDSNLIDGDGCNARCMIEPMNCGNAVCDADEDCVSCMADCQFEPECIDCVDADGDGFNDSACGGMDCNDSDPMVNPDGVEVPCNRIDEDCDVATPDALDEDMDGSSCNFDCDDSDPLRSPLFFERCGNMLDDDCNPDTDDIGDMDGDGFDCDVDCNNFLATSCPTCPEICDNIEDDDCNPLTPDLFDIDGDGSRCDVDCDDGAPTVHPGAAEICDNSVDDDCDASTADIHDVDSDGDDCRTDCDDTDAARASTFTETCGNLIDDDCSAATPDLEDADMDSFSCDVDCDDADPSVVPDASNFCGPRIMYFEDFESGDGGWTTGGTASSWQHGTPGGTHVSVAASGSSAWVTNLTGDYNNSEMSWIESPAMDFSTALTAPVLSFSHIFLTESCCDQGWVEVSTDGGTMWRRVGEMGSGANWYNDSSDEWNGSSGDAGAWRTAQHILLGTAGHADVRIRMMFSSDSSVPEEGFGVDDVRIDNQIVDMAVVAVGIPATTCRSAAHPVTVTYRNDGSVPVTSFDVSYILGGGAPISETVSATVLPGLTYTHLFRAPANLNMPGVQALQARVTTPMDSVMANDSLAVVINVEDIPLVRLGAGYSEDFDTDDGGWATDASGSTWAHGSPAATYISSAASGTSAWVSNLTGDHELSETSTLTSTCFDLSGTSADPTLSFSHIFEIGDGRGWIEVWSSTTGEWRRLGGAGTGVNWYNDAGFGWGGTSGSAGTWRTASHTLDGTAGAGLVRVRHVMEAGGFFSPLVEGFGVDDVTITP